MYLLLLTHFCQFILQPLSENSMIKKHGTSFFKEEKDTNVTWLGSETGSIYQLASKCINYLFFFWFFVVGRVLAIWVFGNFPRYILESSWCTWCCANGFFWLVYWERFFHCFFLLEEWCFFFSLQNMSDKNWRIEVKHFVFIIKVHLI